MQWIYWFIPLCYHNVLWLSQLVINLENLVQVATANFANQGNVRTIVLVCRGLLLHRRQMFYFPTTDPSRDACLPRNFISMRDLFHFPCIISSHLQMYSTICTSCSAVIFSFLFSQILTWHSKSFYWKL